ncbi:hypothetical protein AB0F85_14285 [Nocardia fluminea]|uniref:hypothetical protein n=1 Tax=Nocardia fluminea TaxID=134984 RepID=UPI0033CEF500
MSNPDPHAQNMFVAAEGHLAEHMCQVQLLGLTLPRALELRALHSRHRPDDCRVHLQVAVWLWEWGSG